MKIIGEKIFARDAQGRLLSRIGTIFFRTPGLVTRRGIHALQRAIWIEDVNGARAAAGQPPLTEAEEEAEMAESVDLIFTETEVLIRPNPDRMDLAFRADRELQKMVSKRLIRFLNTSSSKVRAALRERGENWRMARQPISQEDMVEIIDRSRASIAEGTIYYYNPVTGTRFVTAGGYGEIETLAPDAYRRQIAEIVSGLNKRNRLGQPEVDLFPATTPIEIKRRFQTLKVEDLDDAALVAVCRELAVDWRMSLPPELREERTDNFDWRNEMCQALTRHPNETAADEQSLIAGISPEYYRQIEWLPGARIENGKVVFDEIYDEAARTQDPQLLSLCDNLVKSLIFNTTRLFGRVQSVNIGRIDRSLARNPVEGNRRGSVYIMQSKDETMTEPRVFIIRLQKWGVAERLNEGKDLLQAIVESDEYSDYILDRRLMCLQLGMNLPKSIGFGHVTEKYRGANQYNGISVRTAYFVRSYVPGTASDKVPVARFRNPAFARRFAELMGEAAAVDLVVGRRSSVTNELFFDTNYEVLRIGSDGLPSEVLVTDHAGSFVGYEKPFESYVAEYAKPVLRRRKFVADYAAFAEAYCAGFERRLTEVQAAYRAHRAAYDELFLDRPYDTNGSGAYRWACALKRLDACEPAQVAALLRTASEC